MHYGCSTTFTQKEIATVHPAAPRLPPEMAVAEMTVVTVFKQRMHPQLASRRWAGPRGDIPALHMRNKSGSCSTKTASDSRVPVHLKGDDQWLDLTQIGKVPLQALAELLQDRQNWVVRTA